MPSMYYNSFRSSPKPAWWWEDTDDVGLVAFMTANRVDRQNDFSVDRSSTPVLLRWQKYQYVDGAYVSTGVYDSIPITSGDVIDPRYPNLYPSITGAGTIASLDGIGAWASDQDGRPYDINDFLAQ